MPKKTREPEDAREPEKEASDLEAQEGELLPDRDVPSILPTPDEMLRGPFPSP
jgi:hypothetical protein